MMIAPVCPEEEWEGTEHIVLEEGESSHAKYLRQCLRAVGSASSSPLRNKSSITLPPFSTT